jgi:DNA-binding response OmpR family regulator
MTRLSYDGAETVVFDPVAANRTSTRTALYNLGFRRIEAVATLDALSESIKRRPPDLAVCETQGMITELCATIQALRQGATGYNPFIVIIVTAWEHSQRLVSQVLNSGADDLLLRPFSTAVLGQRIAVHAERRKRFVITSDYVGPDRRRDSDRPSSVELFDPPNSLRMKVKDRLTSEAASQLLDQELKAAREILTREKLRRDAFQICVLWRLVQHSGLKIDNFGSDLCKLGDVTRGVARRCVGTEFEPAVAWCDSILAALEGLQLGVDRNASMHLLGYAALNLNQVVAPEKTQGDHLTSVDATVAIIKARTQTADTSNEKQAVAI